MWLPLTKPAQEAGALYNLLLLLQMVVTFDAEAFAQTLQRMAGGRRLHIISRGNRWALIRERTDRALRVLDTKAAAIYHAMPYLATGYDIVVHHRDGTVEGYDTDLVRKVTRAVGIPVVACGGAGKLDHLLAPVRDGGASAVACGSLFVYQGKHRAVLTNYPTRQELTKLFP